jgi:DNA-binding response OmpR family regulator
VIIEDNAAVQRELTGELVAMGYEVLGVDDVGPALHLLQREPWDVVIVDLALRTSYGLFAVDALSDRPAGRKVVVFTVAATDEARRTCETLGCDGLFHRPSQTRELLAFCRSLVA